MKTARKGTKADTQDTPMRQVIPLRRDGNHGKAFYFKMRGNR